MIAYDPTVLSIDRITLRNPIRYLVPIGTVVLCFVMFIVPIAIIGLSGAKVIAGVTIFILCLLWMLRSAWVAPFECAIGDDEIAIRRGSGTRRYGFGQIRKWWFAIPDGMPTQSPPSTNGVLYLVLADRTRFRAEVTAEEAASIAARLPTTSS